MADETSFDRVMEALRTGDARTQAEAMDKVIPGAVQALQRAFGGSTHVDVDEAIASAVRTIMRRNWEFTRKAENDETASLEPRDWGDLAGLVVRFAYNKARTHNNRSRRRQTSSLSGPTDDETGETASRDPAAADGDPQEEVERRELLSRVNSAVDELKQSLEPMDQLILSGKLDGMTFTAIQEKLKDQGIRRTDDAVRARWFRKIVPQLQSLLQDYKDE